jgi:hypothetical protein
VYESAMNDIPGKNIAFIGIAMVLATLVLTGLFSPSAPKLPVALEHGTPSAIALKQTAFPEIVMFATFANSSKCDDHRNSYSGGERCCAFACSASQVVTGVDQEFYSLSPPAFAWFFTGLPLGIDQTPLHRPPRAHPRTI